MVEMTIRCPEKCNRLGVGRGSTSPQLQLCSYPTAHTLHTHYKYKHITDRHLYIVVSSSHYNHKHITDRHLYIVVSSSHYKYKHITDRHLYIVVSSSVLL